MPVRLPRGMRPSIERAESQIQKYKAQRKIVPGHWQS